MDLTPRTRRNFVILAVLWFLFIALSSVAAIADPAYPPIAAEEPFLDEPSGGESAPTMGLPLERSVVQKRCEDSHNLTVCLDGLCTTAPCEGGSICLGPESGLVKTEGCFKQDGDGIYTASNPDSDS